MSTQTQMHEERKIQRELVEEMRQARGASMILEKQAEEKTLVGLKKNTKKIVEVVQAGNLKKVIDKSKQPISTGVTEEEGRGRDKATLRLTEQIKKFVEDEERLTKEPIIKEEVVTTSCGDHILWSPWIELRNQQSYSYQSYWRD